MAHVLVLLLINIEANTFILKKGIIFFERKQMPVRTLLSNY